MNLIEKMRRRYGARKLHPLDKFKLTLDEGVLVLSLLNEHGEPERAPFFLVSRDFPLIRIWPSIARANEFIQLLMTTKREMDNARSKWHQERDNAVREVKTLEDDIMNLVGKTNTLRDQGQAEAQLLFMNTSLDSKRLALRYAKGLAGSGPPTQPNLDLRLMLFNSAGTEVYLRGITGAVEREKARLMDKFGAIAGHSEFELMRKVKITVQWR